MLQSEWRAVQAYVFNGSYGYDFSLIVLVLVRKFERNFLSSKSYESKLEIKLSSSILYIEQMNELVDKKFDKIQKIERKIVNDEKGSYIVIKMRILSNCPPCVNDIFKDKILLKSLKFKKFMNRLFV